MAERVLIFGANGQLGTALARVLAPRSAVTGLNRTAGDIADPAFAAAKVREVAPDLVVNATAYNAVERAGEEAELAYRSNALGPYYLARAARAARAQFIHVSTDYIFDGSKDTYAESDAPRPINVYGASKLAGETLVSIAHPGALIIRTSALFGTGAGKKNFVERMLERADGETVPVVADQRTVPTYAEDLAAGIGALLDAGAAPGTYHLTNAGSAIWAEFAREIFSQARRAVTVREVSTAESGTAIVRPRSTVLVSEKLPALGIVLPSWRDALGRYLSARTPGSHA